MFQSYDDLPYNSLADLSFESDDVVLDISDVLELEECYVTRFASAGCNCKYFGGELCCKTSGSHYLKVRDECRQLTRSELDLVVMGQLLALTQTDQMTQAKKHSPKERRRSFTCFKHGGHVCIRTFCFFHTIGRSNFQSIKAHFESNGLCPRHRSSV